MGNWCYFTLLIGVISPQLTLIISSSKKPYWPTTPRAAARKASVSKVSTSLRGVPIHKKPGGRLNRWSVFGVANRRSSKMKRVVCICRVNIHFELYIYIRVANLGLNQSQTLENQYLDPYVPSVAFLPFFELFTMNKNSGIRKIHLKKQQSNPSKRTFTSIGILDFHLWGFLDPSSFANSFLGSNLLLPLHLPQDRSSDCLPAHLRGEGLK